MESSFQKTHIGTIGGAKLYEARLTSTLVSVNLTLHPFMFRANNQKVVCLTHDDGHHFLHGVLVVCMRKGERSRHSAWPRTGWRHQAFQRSSGTFKGQACADPTSGVQLLSQIDSENDQFIERRLPTPRGRPLTREGH